MQCTRCKEEFKFESQLKRHMERKNPCKVVDNGIKCSFCMKPWDTERQMKRHEKHCLFRDDYVRNLEKQLGIVAEFEYDDSCRFCNKTMMRLNVQRHEKSCKAKKEYQKELETSFKSQSKTKQIYVLKNIKPYMSQCSDLILNKPYISQCSDLILHDDDLNFTSPRAIADVINLAMYQFKDQYSKIQYFKEISKIVNDKLYTNVIESSI